MRNTIVYESNSRKLFACCKFLVDIQTQFEQYCDQKSMVSLALKPMKEFERYGAVQIDEAHRILKFEEKTKVEEGLINCGVYIFNAKSFKALPFPEKFSIENDFFQNYVNKRHFIGFISEAYFLDIGIPKDFEKAQQEFRLLSLD